MTELFTPTSLEAAVVKLTILVVVVLVVVVLILIAVVFAKFTALPFTSKVCLVLAMALSIVGGLWLVAPEVLEHYGITSEAVQQLTTHMWREVDGFTRTHQWVALLMMCFLPLLLWPTDDE